ncbi:zinc finger protein ZAT12-like [Papaver somniferum]|uniref:zinc finger protein ZAT12-like n=1 Tax=Papaver somniferum TaxID=3469 RepID=UPI000E702E89|nr:zinc finger protein ZAT12-like [Papaver somniferum]
MKEMMSNKRRGEMEESMAATMTKCLMLLSRDRGEMDYQSVIQQKIMPSSTQGRFYECKTCDKQFPSFQALGGHRASYKKPRLMELYSSDNHIINYNQQKAKKQKGHECSICGLTFAIGQALGGHMRRHRAAMVESSATTATAETTTTGLSSSSSDDTNISFQEERLPQVPVLKRSNSSRRVLSLNLDLSLSLLPYVSNDFEFSTIVNEDKHMPSSPSMIYSFI